MRIPPKQAAWLQFQLYLATLDGYCPDSFTNSHVCDPSLSDDARWELAVTAICNCLASGLLLIISSEWMRDMGLDDPMDLVGALSSYNPFASTSLGDEGAAYWLEPLLSGSNSCRELIQQHGIANFPQCNLSPQFAKDLEAIFAANSLGWHSIVAANRCAPASSH